MVKVTIYNEFLHEKNDPIVKEVYPQGIHMTLKEGLQSEDILIRTVTLDEEDCGLTKEVLKDTDVLIWWGHMAHNKVPDEVARRVQEEVLNGMGMIFLHSAHLSKPFQLLMGTTCTLSWREDGDREYLWVCDPSHPIAKGIDRYVKLEHEETYCEPFCIPDPDQLVFIANFEGGEAFRAGCCYHRGYGNIFYFQPGHESYPTYQNPQILKIIKNAIYWAKPEFRVDEIKCPHVKRVEE